MCWCAKLLLWYVFGQHLIGPQALFFKKKSFKESLGSALVPGSKRVVVFLCGSAVPCLLTGDALDND